MNCNELFTAGEPTAVAPSQMHAALQRARGLLASLAETSPVAATVNELRQAVHRTAGLEPAPDDRRGRIRCTPRAERVEDRNARRDPPHDRLRAGLRGPLPPCARRRRRSLRAPPQRRAARLDLDGRPRAPADDRLARRRLRAGRRHVAAPNRPAVRVLGARGLAAPRRALAAL